MGWKVDQSRVSHGDERTDQSGLALLATALVEGRLVALPKDVQADRAVLQALATHVVRVLRRSFPLDDASGPYAVAVGSQDGYRIWSGIKALEGLLEEESSRGLARTVLQTVVAYPGSRRIAQPGLAAWLVRNDLAGLREVFDPAVWGFHPTYDRAVLPLFRALFRITGTEGAAIFPVLAAYPPFTLDFQEMRRGVLVPEVPGWTWDPADWTRRLDALADAHLQPRPVFLEVLWTPSPDEVPPPIESAAVQVKIGCRYGTGTPDPAIRSVVANLRHYLTGSPEIDVERYWWPAGTPQEIQRLAEILLASAGAGAAMAMIDLASRRGWIRPHEAQALQQATAQAATEPPAAVNEWTATLDLGRLSLPSGQVAVFDPDDEGGTPAIVDVPVRAGHLHILRAVYPPDPVEGNAVLDLRLTNDTVVDWMSLSASTSNEDGALEPLSWRLAVGSPEAIQAVTADPRAFDAHDDGHVILDYGDRGQVVVVHVDAGPCRIQLGYDDLGRPVRLMVDLGYMEAPFNPKAGCLP